jgi:hypothetical protein
MDVRLILGSLLFLCIAAPSQADAKPAPKQEPAKQEPAKQDPAKPAPAAEKPAEKPQSPGDVLTELSRERERLQSEIEYAKNRAKGANKMLAAKLGTRGQTFKGIDAGTSATAPAPVAQMQKARLMTPAEFEGQPKDVMFLVNGYGVTQGQYDELMQYLAASPSSGTDEIRSQRALFDLIRTYSVVAAFRENEAEGQIVDLYGQMESGKKMADLIKNYTVVQGAKEDGTVEVTRNSFLGTKVEQVVFSLEAGKRSRPFPSPQGQMIAEAISAEKGATTDLDKVTARILVVGWQADPAALQRAQSAAVTGQVDIAVRDQKVMDLLPALFKPAVAAAPPTPEAQIATMTATLKNLDDAILKLSKMDGPDAKTQLESLKNERAKVQTAIESLRKQIDQGHADGDKVPVSPDAPAVKKAPEPIKQGDK